MRTRHWLEFIVAGLVAGVAVTVPAPASELLRVASDSMEPTVFAGEWIRVSAVTAAGVRRGDLVTLVSPDDRTILLKRAVAIAGDEVGIEDGVLVVNGADVDEPYVEYADVNGDYFGPVRVPAGHAFVLGDNRGRAIDSRDFGTVPLTSILGRVDSVETKDRVSRAEQRGDERLAPLPGRTDDQREILPGLLRSDDLQ